MPRNCVSALEAFLASEASRGWCELAPFCDGTAAAVCAAVDDAAAGGAVIAPAPQRIFAALEHTALDKVKVILLGQDPYPTPGDADGLAFSFTGVLDANQSGSLRLPRSLGNIYKELADDLGVEAPQSGDLTHWATQGVLLLNTSLTVAVGAGQAGTHLKLGWDGVTDAIVAGAAAQNQHLVALLWGAHAQKRRPLIDEERHLVIASAHPSPLSARRGFFGSKPFSRTNEFLNSKGVAPICWA